MDQMDVDQRLSSKKRPANQSPLNLPSEKRPKFPFLEDRKADIEEALRSFDAPLKQLVADSDFQHVVATLNFVIKAWEIVDSIPEDAVEIALKSKREEFETVLKRCSESGSWFSGIAYLFSLESNTKTAEIAYVPRLETAEGFRIYLLQNSGIHSQSSFLAIVSAWRTEYKGRTADLVEAILQDYMAATNHYARYVAHIQSSGTGKSRTHDELAKRRFYIPICLASPDQAFPPGDIEVRDWFKNVYWDQETVQRRCNAFLHALMAQAKEALDMIVKDLKKDLDDLADGSIRSARRRLHLLSSTFRQKMSEGGTFGSHGPYRSKFYASVLKRAAEVIDKSVIADAASEVVQLLDPAKYFRAEPVVIICWDESHLLAEQDEGQPWTYFSALRQTLHKIKDMPIFSVFLSTAVKSHLFSPDLQSNPSNRMTTLYLHRFSPITEVGFDEFAIKVKANGESKLGEIASTHHIAHLGRALFATLYDCGDRSIKNSIVNYAQVKLLSSEPSLMRTELRPAELLACLAIRLGLDFRSASWAEREA
ncbi:hypothetical protein CVT26_013472 [Gymnopilus dilepis]|uniref:Uncharacterized protein n=1 Tax=Gymnopilus dilepis TaxID=231916 RepID=A0A409YX13_9AGAR|nr:hypothetical protein CVT26_013472 [Gymnopilus dilepis]